MKNAHRASRFGDASVQLDSPRRRFFAAALDSEASTNAQSLQTVNMAIPSKSFQMVIYPIAQQKGYMKEEGIDQRVIFIAPTTSIQAMLGGDVQFTGAGSSALVSIARANTPLKVVVATNDRVLQWFVTRPDITSPKDLKGKKIATTGVAAIATFMIKQVLSKHGLDGNKDPIYLDVGAGQSTHGAAGRRVRCRHAERGAALYRSRKRHERDVFHGQRSEKFLGHACDHGQADQGKPENGQLASCVRLSKRCATCVRTKRERFQPC